LSETFTGGSPFLPSDPQPSLTGVIDEYEPLRPNDYEDFVKKRKEQRMKERDEERNKKDFDDDKRYGDFDSCLNVSLDFINIISINIDILL
jgi:hypothetical protein